MGSVVAASAAVLVEHCRAVGIDVESLLRDTGISRDTLAEPDARLPARAVSDLWLRAYRATQDEALGLHVAESARSGSYRVTHFIIANSPTVGAAFERLCAYGRWVDDSLQLRIVLEGDDIGIELAPSTDDACGERLRAEHTFALSYLGVVRSTDVTFTPQRLELMGAAPDQPGERERVFRCPALFAQPRNRMWFDHRTWGLPVQGANGALLDLLEAHVQALLKTLPAEPALVSRVRQVICGRLAHGAPTLQQVARQLGLSQRALQRALADSGTSFSEIVETTRIATARALLADRALSIAEVALMLGFSEQSAFTRACKRWLGMPPIKVRALERPPSVRHAREAR
jgi:AraC-like DNA-binding protein